MMTPAQYALDQLGARVAQDRCVVCRRNTLPRCRQEHPRWFTPKRQEPRPKFAVLIEHYAMEHTPQRPCLVTVNQDGRELPLCAEHLLLLAVELVRAREASA